MFTAALLRVTEDFGQPLLVKHTFLHFELYRSETPRALSAPPKVFFSKQAEKIEKKRRARYEEEDIDEVLRLGREQALAESWQLLVTKTLRRETQIKLSLATAGMLKLRVKLSLGGFRFLMSSAGFSERDVFPMFSAGMLREEPDNRISVWSTDRQKTQTMKGFFAEAERMKLFCDNSIFLKLSAEVHLIIFYKKRMKISELKLKAKDLYGSAPLHKIGIAHLTDDKPVTGKTLEEAGIRAGDSLKVVALP